LKKKIINNMYIIAFLLLSIVFGAFVTVLSGLRIITSGMECIPHILTVSSIVLGVVTLVLTIMISIREGKIYNYAQLYKPDIIEQIYGYTISSLISSALSICFSLWIILTKKLIEKSIIYKYMCVFFISLVFVYMILSVSMSFLQSIQLLRLDDRNR